MPDKVVSPDGRWVATELANSGLHEILLKNVATGAERQLTPSHCDSHSPAWELDSKALILGGSWLTIGIVYLLVMVPAAVVIGIHMMEHFR